MGIRLLGSLQNSLNGTIIKVNYWMDASTTDPIAFFPHGGADFDNSRAVSFRVMHRDLGRV